MEAINYGRLCCVQMLLKRGVDMATKTKVCMCVGILRASIFVTWNEVARSHVALLDTQAGEDAFGLASRLDNLGDDSERAADNDRAEIRRMISAALTKCTLKWSVHILCMLYRVHSVPFPSLILLPVQKYADSKSLDQSPFARQHPAWTLAGAPSSDARQCSDPHVIFINTFSNFSY